MIQAGSLLKVCDKTGVVLVKCIKVLGTRKSRIAYMGDIILVSVQHVNPRRLARLKLFRRKRFFKGKIHRGLIIRTKSQYERVPGLFIRFNENSVVLVNKKKVPISNRIYGPVLRELCMLIPSVGSISRYMI